MSERVSEREREKERELLMVGQVDVTQPANLCNTYRCLKSWGEGVGGGKK